MKGPLAVWPDVRWWDPSNGEQVAGLNVEKPRLLRRGLSGTYESIYLVSAKSAVWVVPSVRVTVRVPHLPAHTFWVFQA